MNDEDNFEFLSEKRKNEPILLERKSNKLHKIIRFLIVYFSIFLIYFSRKLNNKFYSFSVNTEAIKEDKGNEDNNLKLALCTMGKNYDKIIVSLCGHTSVMRQPRSKLSHERSVTHAKENDRRRDHWFL